MTEISKFDEKNLPPKDAFNSTLSEGIVFKPDTYGEIRSTEISDKDYKHAQTVFKVFDCKNLGEYTSYIASQMFYYLQMFLRVLLTFVLKNIVLTHHITSLLHHLV